MPGPQNVVGLDPGVFEYTTVEAMREEGLTSQQIDDDTLRKKIRHFSRRVNHLTQQWFAPVIGQAQVDGTGSALIRLPNNVPILRVDQLRILDRGYDSFIEGGYVVDPGEYTISDRYLELVQTIFTPQTPFSLGDSSRATGWGRVTRGVGNFFPAIPLCVLIDGAFGWVEDRKLVLPSSTSESAGILLVTSDDVEAGDTEIPVDTLSGINVGDVVNLGGAGKPRAIVQRLLTTPDRIVVQEGGVTEDIDSGTTLYVFGRVPDDIQLAVQLLVYHNRHPAFAPLQTEFAPAASPDLPIQGSPPSTFNPNPATTGDPRSIGGTGTGIPRVDQILNEYVSPPFVEVI